LTSDTPQFSLQKNFKITNEKAVDKILAAASATDSKGKAKENTKIHMDEKLDRIMLKNLWKQENQRF
jgi:hypothetical protein